MSDIKTLKDLLEYSAKKYENKELYKIDDATITYSEFYNYVKALSNALVKCNITNQRIGIISENRFEWEIAFFAISCSNNTIVPLDKSYTKIEIENVINKAGINTVFTSNNYKEILYEIKKKNTNLENIFCFDNDDKNSLLSLLELGFDENDFFSQTSLNENELCALFFTSGTTDNPKAVMLSQKNICSNLINVSNTINLTENDICLSVLPLNHVLEGLFCFLLSFYKGLTRIFCGEIENICEYIKNYKITFMGGVPAIYNYLYQRKEEISDEANHINMFMCGGAPLNKDLITGFDEIGITLIQGYGLTECSPVVSIENKENKKLGSVGKPIPNIFIDIVNKNEEGIGELIVKGENVFLGYLDDLEKTKNLLKDGWFYTGDLVKIDEDGYIFICGRNKNVIVLPNGKKVFPEEIEQLINKIDGVKESLVYENDLTKKINAIIVTDENNEELIRENIDYINKNLPVYKNINDITITKDDLNKTLTGKLIRDFKNTNNDTNIDNNSSLFDTIKDIIINQFGNREITESTDLRNDLGADSLDKVELFLSIENRFNIELTHDQKKDINTVGDLLKILV